MVCVELVSRLSILCRTNKGQRATIPHLFLSFFFPFLPVWNGTLKSSFSAAASYLRPGLKWSFCIVAAINPGCLAAKYA